MEFEIRKVRTVAQGRKKLGMNGRNTSGSWTRA